MKNKKALLSAVFAAFMLLSACGGSTQQNTSAQDSSTTSQVASASDMTDVEDVVEDGMTPITGDKVKDGTYDVTEGIPAEALPSFRRGYGRYDGACL